MKTSRLLSPWAAKLTEFTHVQEARLAPPKCLQALVPEKLQEQLPKGRQGPEEPPSWGVEWKTSGGKGGKIEQNGISVKCGGKRLLCSTRQDLKPGPFSPGWESLDEVPDRLPETHSVCVSGFSRLVMSDSL